MNKFKSKTVSIEKIIDELGKLSVSKRLYVIEKTMKNIRIAEEENELELASSALLSEYEDDVELTIFTQIDTDNFYEAR